MGTPNNTEDWLNMKTDGPGGQVAAIAAPLTEKTGTFITDGWVGYGDAVDYTAFTIDDAASLSLSFTATEAIKAAVYTLESKTAKGVTTYSLRSVRSVTLKYDRASGKYKADSKAMLLDAGTYYLEVVSTNAAKGGNADYTVAVNQGGSEFFTKGSVDDNEWKGAPAIPQTASPGGDLFGTTAYSTTGWVGYGDPVEIGRAHV